MFESRYCLYGKILGFFCFFFRFCTLVFICVTEILTAVWTINISLSAEFLQAVWYTVPQGLSWVLCSLMALGLRKDIQYHVWQYPFFAGNSPDTWDIKPQAKWAVHLVTVEDHLSQQFVWVRIHENITYFILGLATMRNFQNRYTYVQELTVTNKYRYFLLHLLVGSVYCRFLIFVIWVCLTFVVFNFQSVTSGVLFSTCCRKR